MELTPIEKAVLAQIRVLFYNGAKVEQPVKALHGLWPLTHYEPYKAAFAGLIARQLITPASSERFRITDAGLKAMGVTPPPASPAGGILSRLGFLRPRV